MQDPKVKRLIKAAKRAEEEMKEFVEWHHKHQGGCSVEFEDAWYELKEALSDIK